jgi:GTP cyclohydrolase I
VSSADQNGYTELIQKIIRDLGEDPSREGLLHTPERAVKAYQEVLSGYSRSLESELTVFDNVNNYDDIIYSGQIDFFSMCEHHLLPFFGVAHIAYVPNKKIIGLSKLGRAIDIFSRRLQDQERITTQTASELMRLLDAKGVIVMLEGRHLCNAARGVEKVNSNMKTVVSLGCFREEPIMYDRFFQLVNERQTT